MGRADSLDDRLWHEWRGEQVYDDDTAAPTFEARAGAANEWKIEIPQGLLESLREALAEQESEDEKVPGSGAGGFAPPRAGGGFGPGRGSDDEQENK